MESCLEGNLDGESPSGSQDWPLDIRLEDGLVPRLVDRGVRNRLRESPAQLLWGEKCIGVRFRASGRGAHHLLTRRDVTIGTRRQVAEQRVDGGKG